MEVGIFARTFPRPSLDQTLDAVAATGLRTVQFHPALARGAAPEAVARELAARGLRIAAVSGTRNLVHPDPAVRASNVRRVRDVVAAAPRLGTAIVTLCTGTRDPQDQWRHHPDNATPAAWQDLLDALASLLDAAAAHDVVLGVEPEPGNVVRDARTARRLLDEVGSPHLRIVMDAANVGAAHVEDAFARLGPDVVLAHAKDLASLDVARYLELLRGLAAPVPLVLHGLAEDEVPAAVSALVEA